VTARAATLGLVLLALGACAPKPPPGFDAGRLDAAVGAAIGTPSTCVLVARKGQDRPFYRYGSNVTCGRALPACEGAAATTRAGYRLRAVAAGGAAVKLSCDSNPERSRTVAWAAGASPSRPDIVYAAFMDVENDRALPGRVMADRLTAALTRSGL